MREKHAKTTIGLAACVFELRATPAGSIQLTPVGRFRARDGRPHEVPDGWYIDADVAARVIARDADRTNALVIDYEHQTLHATSNGKPAPAAGWFYGLEWREGVGLFGTGVEWTERATDAINAGEYRYISPVFSYDKTTGEVLQVLMAAVTNYAGLDGMEELTARAAARFDIDEPHKEAKTVNREKIIKMLGLSEDASEEQIESKLQAMRASDDQVVALRSHLSVDESADLVEAISQATTTAVAAARAEVDPAKFVPVETVSALQGELAELRSRVNEGEVESLIEGALSEGKLLPKMVDWARKLGEKDVAQLRAFIDAAQPVAALTGMQSNTRKNPPENGGEYSETELAVLRAMNLNPPQREKEAG